MYNQLQTRRGRPRGSTRGRGGTTRRMSATHMQEDADESSLFSMVKSGKNLHVSVAVKSLLVQMPYWPMPYSTKYKKLQYVQRN